MSTGDNIRCYVLMTVRPGRLPDKGIGETPVAGLDEGIVSMFGMLFTCFERVHQIVMQMLEELSHEKSYCT